MQPTTDFIKIMSWISANSNSCNTTKFEDETNALEYIIPQTPRIIGYTVICVSDCYIAITREFSEIDTSSRKVWVRTDWWDNGESFEDIYEYPLKPVKYEKAFDINTTFKDFIDFIHNPS
jgi:hypothetical protein